MCFIYKAKPYVVAYLKPSNYGRDPILSAHKLFLVDFVPNLISTFFDKEDLKALVKLIGDGFFGIIKSGFD